MRACVFYFSSLENCFGRKIIAGDNLSLWLYSTSAVFICDVVLQFYLALFIHVQKHVIVYRAELIVYVYYIVIIGILVISNPWTRMLDAPEMWIISFNAPYCVDGSLSNNQYIDRCFLYYVSNVCVCRWRGGPRDWKFYLVGSWRVDRVLRNRAFLDFPSTVRDAPNKIRCFIFP